MGCDPSDTRPLAGLRIAVTRPRDQAGPLAEELELLGANVVVVPLIAIEPVGDPDALDALLENSDHDWIVLTSVNAVRAVGERLPRVRGARVAAVGPATAEAIRALGIEPAFVPERFTSEAIADGLGSLRGARVLLPESAIADPRLAAELEARGASVDAVAAYRTVSVEPSDAELDELRRADAILLASGSAARMLASVAPSVDRALLVCIGDSTAGAARSAGLRVGLVAEEATAQGMIHALVSYFGKSA